MEKQKNKQTKNILLLCSNHFLKVSLKKQFSLILFREKAVIQLFLLF